MRGLVTRRRWWIGAAVVLLISVMAVTLWRAGPPAGTAGAVDPPPAVPMTPAPSAPSDTASPTPSTPPAEATAPAGSIATTEAVETTETAESTATADVSDPAEARPPAGVSGLAVEDPAEATAALASLRQRALTERDPELLGTYTVAGSPAAEGDARILSQLQDSGLRYQDLTLGLTPTGPVSPSGQGRVRIPARLDISAYTVVDEHGTTVEEHPAGRQDAVLLELERGPEGWRAVQVMAPPAG